MSSTLPGYEILGVLAAKPNTVIYKAKHIRLNQVVAVKTLRPQNIDEARLFQQEIRFLAMLRHPNILRAYDADCFPEGFFVVTEYIEGGELAAKLGRPWPARDAVNLTLKLADALHTVHEQRLIHRRIEPSHILLTVEGEPRLTGFRFSLLAEEAANRGITPASDIHDLGVVFYEMLTGQRPADSVVSPSQIAPNIPKGLGTICLKCLEDRYQSAQELAHDLKRQQKRGWRRLFGG
jgi:eukaryotic-like serine/threonine-protein kinase